MLPFYSLSKLHFTQSCGLLFIFNFLCVILFHISMPMRGDSKGDSSACVVHRILMTLTENMVQLL